MMYFLITGIKNGDVDSFHAILWEHQAKLMQTKKCGERYHSEVIRFRFSFEMINVIIILTISTKIAFARWLAVQHSMNAFFCFKLLLPDIFFGSVIILRHLCFAEKRS